MSDQGKIVFSTKIGLFPAKQKKFGGDFFYLGLPFRIRNSSFFELNPSIFVQLIEPEGKPQERHEFAPHDKKQTKLPKCY